MSTQNSFSHRLKYVKSYRISVCDFIGYIQALISMPVLVCSALLFSSSSYSNNNLMDHVNSSSQDSYQAKLHLDDKTDEATLKFSGNPPASLDGYDLYTIDGFNLKIGNKEYPVTEHDDYSKLLSIMKLEDLHYSVDNFPHSELVFSYELSTAQVISEFHNCFTSYSGFAVLMACVMDAWKLFWKTHYHSIDVTSPLVKAISYTIKDIDTDVKNRFGHSAARFFGNLRFDFYRKEMIGTFPSDANLEDKIKLEQEYKQAIALFSTATFDYFEKVSTSLLDAYNRQMLGRKFLESIDDTHHDDREKFVYKAIKPFESEKCQEELPSYLVTNLGDPRLALGDPRLALIAKSYATEICHFNTISFNGRTNTPINPPTFKGEATDKGQDHSTFVPYAFCDKYRCVIHVSEILYYRLSLSDLATALVNDEIDDIRSYLVLDRKVPSTLSKCSPFCTISDDIVGLQKVLDNIIMKPRIGWADWMLIMYKNNQTN